MTHEAVVIPITAHAFRHVNSGATSTTMTSPLGCIAETSVAIARILQAWLMADCLFGQKEHDCWLLTDDTEIS